MGLMEAWGNIEQHLHAVEESAKARLEQDLPEVAAFVKDASTNPVVTAIANAEHLTAVPSLMQLFADFVTSVDNALGDAKQAAASPPASPGDQPADGSAPVQPEAPGVPA